ncbi:RimK/LysX family protein [Catenovulum sp. 2E275]|uniref:ATP-dependent zinc protease family protein n=1 Tax=Catenovulum sp. 2E275 TaxID=2980497 RepID=UPI0021CE1E2C|nr:RimK/LysX family protein [Catenovulum sp. 2E275]MCU4674595.1 RimK/LysX family protein [Catenovulum sp. 2E275]
MKNKLLVGALEVCHLPKLGIKDLTVRVDTGAQTSSIHVDNLRKVTRKGKPWVEFDIHPNIYNVDEVIHCESPIKDIRWVKSSNGTRQQRYVIETVFEVGGQNWPILITLTDRSDMTYMMLLGREGMQDKILVDPSETFLCTEHAQQEGE